MLLLALRNEFWHLLNFFFPRDIRPLLQRFSGINSIMYFFSVRKLSDEPEKVRRFLCKSIITDYLASLLLSIHQCHSLIQTKCLSKYIERFEWQIQIHNIQHGETSLWKYSGLVTFNLLNSVTSIELVLIKGKFNF